MKLNHKLIITGKLEHEQRKNEHENFDTLIIGGKWQQQNWTKSKTKTQELNKNCETESQNVITRENRNTKDEWL